MLSIAVLIDDLRSDDVTVRLNSLDNLEVIAHALGPARCRRELLPFLMDMSDDEDSVLAKIAIKLGKLVEHVGGAEYCDHLVRPLEQLIAIEEESIRGAAMSSMLRVCSVMDYASLREHVTPVILRLSAADWYVSRIAACHVGSMFLSIKFGPEVYSRIRELCKDDTPRVRKAAFLSIASTVNSIPDALQGDLIDSLIRCAEDEEESVRQASVDVISNMLRPVSILSDTYLHGISRVIAQISDDTSWKVRVSILSSIDILISHASYRSERTSVVLCITKLCQDTDPEVRATAVAKLSECMNMIDSESDNELILQAIDRISRDSSDAVRLSLASSFYRVHHLAAEQFLKYCLSGFLILVRDESVSVRLNALHGIRLLPASIPLETLKVSILPSVREVLIDKNWRVRRSLAELIPELFPAFHRAGLHEDLCAWIERLLCDPVFAVRESTACALSCLCDSQGGDFTAHVAVPILSRILTSSNYLFRIIAIICAGKCLLVSKDSQTAQFIIEMIEPCTLDAVANVRLNLVKILHELVRLFPQVLDRVWKLTERLMKDADIDVQQEYQLFLRSQ